jgi:thiamine-phosphate pyrophosphorylase
MELIVISPESAEPRERAAMEGFFGEGLGRYHVRKPLWTAQGLESWLRALPAHWLPRIVLHQHHELVGKLGVGGAHERDTGTSLLSSAASRSCHGLESLRASLGRHPYVIFGPVFPSLTKRGYAPDPEFPWHELKGILSTRPSPPATRVFAIGGVTAAGLPRCRELGFDGAAVLGAVWDEAEPVRAYIRLREAAEKLEANRHAA